MEAQLLDVVDLCKNTRWEIEGFLDYAHVFVSPALEGLSYKHFWRDKSTITSISLIKPLLFPIVFIL